MTPDALLAELKRLEAGRQECHRMTLPRAQMVYQHIAALLPQIIAAVGERQATIAIATRYQASLSDIISQRDALQQRVTRMEAALAELAGEWAVLSARPSMTPSEDRHYSRALANHSAALLQLLVESRAAGREGG